MAQRAEQHQLQHLQQQYGASPSSMSPASSSSAMVNQAGPSSGSGPASSTFNFASNQQQQRRPQMAHQGVAGMGGMGGSMRPPGKSGLTFDHILSRLQGELQKSRETGAELHTLTGAMHDIHETLGGGLVGQNCVFINLSLMFKAASQYASLSPNTPACPSPTGSSPFSCTGRCFRSPR